MAARTKLTTQDREDIFRRISKGVAVAVLAEEFHVSENCIRVTVKKFKAGPISKPNPPAPETHYAEAPGTRENLFKVAAAIGRSRVIDGFPGASITSEFKTAIADMCRQAFEEKIKEALDAIFFAPGTVK